MNEIVIRKTWLTWKIVPLTLFVVFWDGFLFVWYSTVLSQRNPPLMAVVFPILHVAVGLGITYYVLASFVNRTDIAISSMGVRVQTGPAPWAGNKQVRAEDIYNVLVRERTGNRGSKSYSVVYADRSRQERKLVTSLAERDQAAFVAQSIRDTLGIKPEDA